MSEKIEQLKNIIQDNPSLDQSDKDSLLAAVGSLNDQTAEYLWFLIDNNPDNLVRISKYFKAKSEVFATHDPEKIKAFLDQHYQELLDEARQE